MILGQCLAVAGTAGHTGGVRIVIAPDKFAGTLSAIEAAQAIADGWRRVQPEAETELIPLSDGGPGFVEVLHTALGGKILGREVSGPLGAPVRADYLLDGETATSRAPRRAACTCSRKRSATRCAPPAAEWGSWSAMPLPRVPVPSSSALAAAPPTTAAPECWPLWGPYRRAPWTRAARLSPPCPARSTWHPRAARSRGVRLVAATDVDNPLLGLHGASAVFGPQKGADDDQVQRLDAALTAFADATDPSSALRDSPGAGAAGGLGYGLLLLGGAVESGVARILSAVDLAAKAASADLLITGEGSFDSQSLRGKLPHGVARTAAEHGVPCVVTAGVVSVGRQEVAAAGITETYSLVESAGSVEAALTNSAEELRKLAADVARRWHR